MGMFDFKNNSDEPVLIGGIGGSGTRLVAQLVSESGYYLGNNLNTSRDNMTVMQYLPAMRDILLATGKSRASEKEEKILVIIQIFLDCIQAEVETSSILYKKWGWKVPASYMLLPYFKRIFPNLKYIHVIRNGLDMAFSNNQNQSANWPSYFGLKPCAHNKPGTSLEFWIQANKLAVGYGQEIKKGSFMLLNFDSLCKHPARTIDQLTNFLGGRKDIRENLRLQSLIKRPASINRYKEHGLDCFTKEQLESVQEFGFNTDEFNWVERCNFLLTRARRKYFRWLFGVS